MEKPRHRPSIIDHTVLFVSEASSHSLEPCQAVPEVKPREQAATSGERVRTFLEASFPCVAVSVTKFARGHRQEILVDPARQQRVRHTR